MGAIIRSITSIPRLSREQAHVAPERLVWGRVNSQVVAALGEAIRDYKRRQTSAWIVRTACLNGVGRDVLKSLQQSPDSICQMAMQCAWYSIHGRVPSHYESVQTIRWRLGRTEAGRCASLESKELAELMTKFPGPWNAEEEALLVRALRKRVKSTPK